MKDIHIFRQTLEENHLRPDVTLLSLEENEDGSIYITTLLEDGQNTDFTICAEDVTRIEERMRQ